MTSQVKSRTTPTPPTAPDCYSSALQSLLSPPSSASYPLSSTPIYFVPFPLHLCCGVLDRVLKKMTQRTRKMWLLLKRINLNFRTRRKNFLTQHVSFSLLSDSSQRVLMNLFIRVSFIEYYDNVLLLLTLSVFLHFFISTIPLHHRNLFIWCRANYRLPLYFYVSQGTRSDRARKMWPNKLMKLTPLKRGRCART